MDVYYTFSGDTWDIISFNVYGSEKYANRLIEENPNLSNIAIFSSGIEVIVPDILIDISEDLPPWKRSLYEESKES